MIAKSGQPFKLSLLVLMVTVFSTGLAMAGSTPTTAPVQGTAPVIIAPSNQAKSAVDFEWAGVNQERLSTGDTIVMKYLFQDTEGDKDNSHTTIKWSYRKADNTSVSIDATHVPDLEGLGGTSTIVIPAAALGALAIQVELDEQSTTGNPRQGSHIVVMDTSMQTAPSEGGGGGNKVTPPGPILPGGEITGGIFLASDQPAAGSSTPDYSRDGISPKVGETYIFKAWVDSNSNGIWDTGELEMTASLSSIQWILDGSNVTAAGGTAPVVLTNHAIPGATQDTYTVPVNNLSSSGSEPGEQGFVLKVEFN